MPYSPILAPVVALVLWSLLVMLWMAVTRLQAFSKLGITLGNVPRGARGADLEGKVPAELMWKSHNYAHLMEQPTIFYAIAFALALMAQGDGINLLLAWGYVILRVLHSLVQATVNIVLYRLMLFILSSLCLVGLTVSAAVELLQA